MLTQFIINGIIIGSIYGLLGTGFSIIYHTTKIFHIAYSILYMVAGYFIFSFANTLNFPWLLSLVLALFLTIIISILIEKLVYQPLEERNANHNTQLIASLGVMIIGINVIVLFYGNETKLLSNTIASSITFKDLIITYPQLLQFVVSIVLLVLFYLLLKYSSFGLKIKAIKDDVVLAKIQGINTNRIRLYVFAISGCFAAVSGILMAYDIGFDPYIGLPMLLNAVVAMIIGGNKKFYTTLLGGILLGVIQALVIWKFSANWQEAITFVVLILFLLLRPQGLLGTKTREV